MQVRAYAKINLTLEVLGRRPDGYHEVRSVLHTIELHDSLCVELASDLSLRVEVEEMPGQAELALPAEGNLALKAARTLRAQAGVAEGAALRLRKRIPVAAGLGGGSSDAAAALRALNALWRLSWSERRLSTLAATLGTDVPFFLISAAALATGRGDEITPLPPLRPTWVVLVTPKVSIPDKTRWAYSQLGLQHYSSGAMALDLAHRLRSQRSDIGGCHLRNVFEPLVVEKVPEVQRCRCEMWRAGARGVNLTGAGPSLFTLIDDADGASDLAQRLRLRLGVAAAVVVSQTGWRNGW